MTDKKRVNSTEGGADRHNIAAEQTKRPYARPEVLSSERLEAAAATCDPPTGGYGKSVPIPCSTTLGS